MSAAPVRARATGIVLALAIAIAAPEAWADTADQCISGAEQGEQLLRRGKPTEARQRLYACRRPSCPQVLREVCERLAARVEEASASVVFAPVDESGVDVSAGAIEIDGAPVEYEPGRAFELDPGNHSVVVRSAQFDASRTTFTVREGEKRRIVTVRLQAARKREDTPPATIAVSSGPPLASVILLGGGAAALASSAVLGVLAKVEYDGLEARCASPLPGCSRDDTAMGRAYAVASTVTLGVGIATAAVGLVLWWLDARQSAARSALQRPLRF